MYSSLQLAAKYITYYVTAFNGKGHGMHSPFVFDFILHVLNNKMGYTPPAAIEDVRTALLQDTTLLKVEDYGAGSRVHTSKQKTVQQIANSAVKPKKYSHLFYRLVKHYQPQTIIELGTSLGISTAYMASANPSSQLVTIEGSSAIQGVAQTVFKKLDLPNIQSLQGNFDDQLPNVLAQLQTVDLAYIDGNHRYQPTINYFHQLVDKAHPHTILIFDDIHWSEEMEQAWQYIQQHPSVTTTIDLFFIGIVLLRPEFKVKQHFAVRY